MALSKIGKITHAIVKIWRCSRDAKLLQSVLSSCLI
jgi:hypothetical protein